MKKKFLGMGLSFLLVAALVLTGCPAPIVEEPVVEEPVVEEPVVEEPVVEEPVVEEPVVVPGEPQYGGTFTVATYLIAREPPTFDEVAPGGFPASIWAGPYIDSLFVGDIFKYGPRGTNEYPFAVFEYVPEQYMGSALAESWEMPDDLTIVLNIRQGVMWTGREGVMEPRELTADDIAFSLNRLWGMWAGGGMEEFFAFIKSITATDRYTVVIELNRFYALWMGLLGYGYAAGIYPPEVIETGAAGDWRNAVGTGPFIITDYIKGSVATYERNPNYWNSTIIDGEEYELPFIDTLIYPIIMDESTQIAALRTAKVDMHTGVPLMYEETLAATSPELRSFKYPWCLVKVLELKRSADSQYFSNKNIRRAMMIATDLEAIMRGVYSEGVLLAFPFTLVFPESTPFEELPASAQELFSYNPEKARQMLADEGYPDGFKVEMVIGPDPKSSDVAAMFVSNWADIGVEVTLIPMEVVALQSVWGARTFKDCLLDEGEMGNSHLPFIIQRGESGGLPGTSSWWEDPYFKELTLAALGTTDAAERTRLIRELGVYWLEQVMYIPLCDPIMLNMSWPWVNNYYGELSIGFFDFSTIWASLWIDQDLKAEMGY